MSDEHIDPSGNTEAFQAFARRTGLVEQETAAGGRSKVGVMVGAIATVIIVVAVVWFFLAR